MIEFLLAVIGAAALAYLAVIGVVLFVQRA